MNRVVFDTNVIFSAMIFIESVPGRVFLEVLNNGTILMSRSLARKLSLVLGRDKFDRYASPEQRDEFLIERIGPTKGGRWEVRKWAKSAKKEVRNAIKNLISDEKLTDEIFAIVKAQQSRY